MRMNSLTECNPCPIRYSESLSDSQVWSTKGVSVLYQHSGRSEQSSIDAIEQNDSLASNHDCKYAIAFNTLVDMKERYDLYLFDLQQSIAKVSVMLRRLTTRTLAVMKDTLTLKSAPTIATKSLANAICK